MSPRQERRAFVWIPKPVDEYSIEIDGVDVTDDAAMGSEFTKALIGLESPCKITLIDSDGAYAEKYVGGETVELKLIRVSDETITSLWKGTLEKPKKQFGNAFTVEIIGSHYQSDLLDITVTAEFTGGTSADTILKTIIDDYLTGYTYVNVKASTAFPTVRWNNKPFYDCVVDLMREGLDIFVDEDKDFHSFDKESIDNDDEALVWDDNLLEIESLGVDTIDVRNRIIVYGEDGAGMPIIYQADDTESIYKTKEKIIKDSSIRTYQQAKDLGDAELALIKTPPEKGKVQALFLSDLRLGEMTYVINPIQKVHKRFRPVKYTYVFPSKRTTVIFQKEETIPDIFKERKNAELASENLVNPFKMTNSYNFSFDDLNNIDETESDNVTVAESNLKIVIGSSGQMISNVRNSTTDITYVHLKVAGDFISNVSYYISTDDGENWAKVTLEAEIAVTAGKKLRLKVEIASASTLIQSIAVLYR